VERLVGKFKGVEEGRCGDGGFGVEGVVVNSVETEAMEGIVVEDVMKRVVVEITYWGIVDARSIHLLML